MITKLAVLSKADVAVTTRYVLVDKSGVANFPHKADEDLRIESLSVMANREGTRD